MATGAHQGTPTTTGLSAMVRTTNGGYAAVGTEFDYSNTTAAERRSIEEREQRLDAWRRSLPKRKRPAHEKAGPVTWIQL
jgi:hypothetical protein